MVAGAVHDSLIQDEIDLESFLKSILWETCEVRRHLLYMDSLQLYYFSSSIYIPLFVLPKRQGIRSSWGLSSSVSRVTLKQAGNVWCRFSEPKPPFRNTKSHGRYLGWCRALSWAFPHTSCLPSKWIWECDETCPVLARLYHTCARRKRIYKHIFPSATTVLSSTNFLSFIKKDYQRTPHGLDPLASFLKIPHTI